MTEDEMQEAIHRLECQVVALAAVCGHLARGLVSKEVPQDDVESHLRDAQAHLPHSVKTYGEPIVKMIVATLKHGSVEAED
ncbi:hypothetical protein D3877_12810 [Azospirillum cavernae]|uniref:Uncharacterized protein n=1 Tax=Azospirillum cavernae TaxID=2320860 RepID=A0A418VVF8_9PROT|nr:hypothetical protein [Azospirillum cavernae]RJF81099.1 hypothetical protein D3877_12810 [Azospirillum cavernae]